MIGGEGGPCSKSHMHNVIIVTEILKWFAIVAGLYLSVWQYCDILNYYPVFVSGTSNVAGQFWGVFTAIIVGASLVVYLPWRIISRKLREKYDCVMDNRWKPAILAYILLCATPSFTLILYAFESVSNLAEMDPLTVTVLQIVVLGLVLTEWMTKIQQEMFSFNLVTAMALDFFFAYDVIAFVMMASTTYVSKTGWIYPCFVCAVIAMFKYLPTQPIKFSEGMMSIGHVVCILTSMICNDIPFIVIRLSTIIIFESFLISDMVFLVKNFFVIIFDLIQLGVMFYNYRKRQRFSEAMTDHLETQEGTSGLHRSPECIPEQRMFRGEKEVWQRIGEIISTKNKVAASESNGGIGKENERNCGARTTGIGEVNEAVDLENIDSVH